MHARVTEGDRNRCILCVRFRVINKDTRTIVRVGFEIVSDPDDLAPQEIVQRYKEPVVDDSRSPIEVCVFDPKAVDLRNHATLLGDPTAAIIRCEEALEALGYTVLPFEK